MPLFDLGRIVAILLATYLILVPFGRGHRRDALIAGLVLLVLVIAPGGWQVEAPLFAIRVGTP